MTGERETVSDGQSAADSPAKSADRLPFLSVVIPVYNDPQGLRVTLESVTDQEYPDSRYEILVVDNDSTDETPAVIDEFERDYPDLVTGLSETRIQSSYAARNTGIRNARGSIIAFIDADMISEADWLGTVADSLTNNPWDYIACNVEVFTPAGQEGIVSTYTERYHFNIRELVTESNYGLTCSLAVTAEVFEEVGLFDPRLVSCGDLLFGKLSAAKFEQHFVDDITLYHPARTTLREIHDRYVRIGRGFAQLQTYYDIQPPFSHTNPRDYLPPNPRPVIRQLRRQTTQPVSIRQLIAFYLIEYLKILARLRGHVIQSRIDSTDGESKYV